MPDYKVFETDEFLSNLEKLLARDIKSIRGKLTDYAYPRLKKQPRFGANIRKLRGYTPETWRYRIGRFRIFYIIVGDERMVYILTIEARKDAYR